MAIQCYKTPQNSPQTRSVLVSDAKTLRELREGNGWTLRDAADHLPVSKDTISRYERAGDVPPKYRDDYAKAFGVSREVIDSLCATGPTPLQPVRSDASMMRWTQVASTSDLHPYARMMLLVFPTFLDRDTWVVSLTKDTLEREAHLSRADIDAHWGDAVDSDFVRRVGEGTYTFQLMVPSDDN